MDTAFQSGSLRELEIDYVKIQVADTVYYMAEALIDTVFAEVEGEREVLAKFKGKDLEYREYEPLYPYAVGKLKKKSLLCHLRWLCNNDGWYRYCRVWHLLLVRMTPVSAGNMICRLCSTLTARVSLRRIRIGRGVFVKDADRSS